jgi:2-iminobutanoate/2-iminopropanoate deaminase
LRDCCDSRGNLGRYGSRGREEGSHRKFQRPKSGRSLFPGDPIRQPSKGAIEEQTKLVLENLKAVLEAAGLNFSNVLATTCFLKNLDDFTKFNAVYGNYFPENPPARATVEVARLPKDVSIEIALVAGK